MLKSGLCDYNDAYIRLNGTVIVAELLATGGNKNENVIFKTFAPLTCHVCEIMLRCMSLYVTLWMNIFKQNHVS